MSELYKGITLAFCALFLFAPRLFAAEADTLTPARAVEVALAHNGELAAARHEMGLREAAKLRAGLWPNPEFAIEGAFADSSENAISAGISQEFVTGGKLRKRALAAGKDMATYAHELADAGRRLKEEVKQAYWDAVFAEKSLALAGRAAELNGELVRVADERFRADDIPEVELSLARVEMDRAGEGMLASEMALAEARSRLFTLMGVPDAGERLDDAPAASASLAPAELKAAALANRPDIKALAAASGKADADLDAARANKWPDVTATLFYEHENSAIEAGEAELKDRDNFFGLRFSAPIPVFNRGQAGVMEARTSKGAAVTRRESLEGRVAKEVDLACRRLELARSAVELYAGKVIPRLEENRALVREAYALGEVGILNIIEEQRKFFEVNERYLAAQRDAARAAAALEAAVGMELDGGGR